MSTIPSIELKNIVFAYGGHPILHDINFTVEQGNLTVIMGGSGSGKTTLVRLITGQTHPQQGQVLIGGHDVARFSSAEFYERHRRMDMLFQHSTLFTGFSVHDNIASPMYKLTGLPEDIIRDLVILKLNAVGLCGVERLMPSELSGGISRHIVLTRAIVLDPEIMLYDEPFTGLDPTSLGMIVHLISRVNKALYSTSIMVTYDIEKSLEIVNQIIFLAHGEIMFSGSPQEMCELDSLWVRQFIGGLADESVAFRHPTQTMLQQGLMGQRSPENGKI